MSLSISWLAAVPAAIATKQTVSQAASSLTRSFGDLLRPKETPAPSGRSAPTDPSPNPESNSATLGDIQQHLTSVALTVQRNLGQDPNALSSDVELIVSPEGEITIHGPDDLRIGIQNYLQSNPKLVDRIRELAKNPGSSNPLALLPNKSNPTSTVPMPSPLANDPVKLTLIRANRLVQS